MLEKKMKGQLDPWIRRGQEFTPLVQVDPIALGFLGRGDFQTHLLKSFGNFISHVLQ